MDHTEIRGKLSAYLENSVAAGEKEEIKDHLARCGSCRSELADLEWTIGEIKRLPDLEAPPWLTERIMKEVAEISAPRPSLWQKLFFPLHLKLPIEALALVFICITGYYFARTTETQAPVLSESGKPQGPILQKPAADSSPPLAPVLPRGPGVQSPEARPKSEPLPPLPQPYVETKPAPREKTEMGTAPATPRPASRLQEAPGLLPADEDGMQALPYVKARKAPTARKSFRKDMVEEESAPVAGSAGGAASSAEVTLQVDDSEAAVGPIEQAVTRLDGRIAGHAYEARSHLLNVRIEAQKLPLLLDRLGRLGTIKQRPPVSKGATGTVDLTIKW